MREQDGFKELMQILERIEADTDENRKAARYKVLVNAFNMFDKILDLLELDLHFCVKKASDIEQVIKFMDIINSLRIITLNIQKTLDNVTN